MNDCNIVGTIKQARFTQFWRAIFLVCHAFFCYLAFVHKRYDETHPVLLRKHRIKKQHVKRRHKGLRRNTQGISMAAKRFTIDPGHKVVHVKLAHRHSSELSEQEYALLVEHAKTCSTCESLLGREAIVEEWLQGLEVREPVHTDSASRPALPFPPKISRMWEFQEEQERILHYDEWKRMYARKNSRRWMQYVFKIVVLVGFPVLGVGIATLLNLIMEHAARISALIHSSAQFVQNFPGTVHTLFSFLQQPHSSLDLWSIAPLAGLCIVEMIMLIHLWRARQLKRRSKRQLQKKADSIVREHARECVRERSTV